MILRKFQATVLVALLGASIANAIPMQFSNTTPAPTDAISGNGTVGQAVNGWLVGLYKETGGGAGFQWGSDTLADSAPTAGSAGNQFYNKTSTGSSLFEGDVVYAVIFNRSTLPGMGDVFYYSVGVNGSYTMTSQPIDQKFNFGGDGSWVLVPEPSTLAILAIGLVTIAARRRFVK